MKVTMQISRREVQTPTEGKWFKVNPLGINQKLFRKKRRDVKQEKTRLLILDAFIELKINPEKYGRAFETMMPEKTWTVKKTVEELKELASVVGDHTADWVEQSLEWAQRICNGESWETICNNADTANWYRMILWKNGYARFVGGSRCDGDTHPASDVGSYDYCSIDTLMCIVPLVVHYNN